MVILHVPQIMVRVRLTITLAAPNYSRIVLTLMLKIESYHFPLFCQLTFEKVLNTDPQASIQNDQLHDQVKFRWSDEKSADFLQRFRNLYHKAKDEMCQLAIQDIDTSVKKLTETFHKAASAMKVKDQRYTRVINTQSAWWDVECDSLKQIKYSALRKFRVINEPADLQFYKDSRNVFVSSASKVDS